MSLNTHHMVYPAAARKKAENIMVVRPGGLGDTILTIPLILSIQEKHPSAKITLLGNSAYSRILPGDISFEDLGSMKFSRLFQVNRAGKPSAGITPPDLVFLIAKSPEPLLSNLKSWTNGPVIWIDSAPKSGIHMVNSFHSQIGLPTPEKKPCLVHIKPDTKINRAWIHPGSGGRNKCQDLGFFLELSAKIHWDLGIEIYFSLGYADNFLKSHPEWPLLEQKEWISIIDNQPLDQLCALLGGSRLFVGNDSGISHFAANLGVPGIVMFKETDPRVWSPWVGEDQVGLVEILESGPDSEVSEQIITTIKQLVKLNS